MPANCSPTDPGPRLLLAPLRPAHLDQVLAIERLSFPHPWARHLFEAELRYPQALCLGAFGHLDQRLWGYAILWIVVDEAQIQNLAVHPDQRGRGVARRMLASALAEARRRGASWASLEVRPSNLPARRLYAGLGFQEVGRRPGYYQPEGEDALLLNAELTTIHTSESA
ncbi:MAG: ribosomal protein S18-alanine N-acetyltransferase [Desulfarculus sp.]|nr:ribosomal protein S18-alanine N-acetyltransferase [Desulfarculus sp.]